MLRRGNSSEGFAFPVRTKLWKCSNSYVTQNKVNSREIKALKSLAGRIWILR